MNEQFILHAMIGSRSVGTHTPESDYDFMGVVLGGSGVYLGMDQWGSQGTRETKDTARSMECVEYELRKFMGLCSRFNPNVIPLLWLKSNFYTWMYPQGQLLIDNRHLFNSKLAVHSFVGYAYGQIEKMAATDLATGKMGARRKTLREKWGFDVKYGYHAVRLARMIVEFLKSDGESLNVWRGDLDAEELLVIRNGARSYSEIKSEVEELLKEATMSAKTSKLPDQPDRVKLNQLCEKILRSHLAL